MKFDNLQVEGELPFENSLITININDDGAPTAKGSHSNPKLSGSMDIFPYLEEMLNRSLAETEKLVPEKLLLLLERYMGNSVDLPAHEGIDDRIYGSLTVYKQEVIDELNVWMDNHSTEEMDIAVKKAIRTLEPSKQSAYTAAWEEILSQR